MKYSKVDHVRLAVISKQDAKKKEPGKYSENFYKDPKRNKSDKNPQTQEYVESRIKNARDNEKTPYVILKAKPGKGKRGDIEKSFRRLMDEIIACYDDKKNLDSVIKEQISKIKNFNIGDSEYKCDNDNLSEEIEAFILTNLKAGLKKRKAIPVIVELFKCMCYGKQYSVKVKEIKEQELKEFLLILNEDYSKRLGKTRVVKSFENKDVKVQVNTKDKVLELAFVSNASEKSHKKELFEFMKAYSVGESAAREQLYLLKKIVLTYFYGKSGSWNEEYKDKDIWDFSWVTENEFEPFSTEVEEYLTNPDYLVDWELEDKELKRAKDKAKILKQKAYDKMIYEIYGRYLKLRADESFSMVEQYWFKFIKESLEKKFKNRRQLVNTRIATLDLCQETWKHMISFLCGKYIDLGKGVYHFTIQNTNYANIDLSKPQKYGEILKPYRKGISSFHYEQIKAEESIEKDVAVDIVFALNNFQRAVALEEVEDYLSLHGKERENGTRKDAALRILRFFGGQSEWNEVLSKKDKENLVLELQKVFIVLRNRNFHYNFIGKGEDVELPVLEKMYKWESERYGEVYKKRFYSNNVPLFYSLKDIESFMNWLYAKKRSKPAQIPSFSSILKRKNLMEFLKSSHFIDFSKIPAGEVQEQFLSMIYYVLKEIYYRRFINHFSMKTYFTDAVEKEKKFVDEKYNVIESKLKKTTDEIERKRLKKESCIFDVRKKAIEDFSKRIDRLIECDLGFGAICQNLMTEYNLQNMNVKKGNEKYQHYKMLLMKCLNRAFESFIVNEVKKDNAFLEFPKFVEDIVPFEQFLPEWKCDWYKDVEINKELLRWYALGRILHPRQLNFLIGDIKDYQQYTRNISKRAQKYAEIDWDKSFLERVLDWDVPLEVLEFCLPYSGLVSHEFSDYYEDENEYACYLSQFVDFELEEFKEFSLEPFNKLSAFCNKKTEDGQVYGIYTDAKNPIILRNVELSRMYGCGNVLASAFKEDKVNTEDIENYYEQHKKLQTVFNRGECINEEEQRSLVTYQRLKNKVELHNLLTYSELINDLIGQLVNFSYYRERDQIFFRLGYYYMRLKYTDATEGLDEFVNDKINVEKGYVLNQILAINSFGMKMYNSKNEECKKENFWGKLDYFMDTFKEESTNKKLLGMVRIQNSLKELYKNQKLRNWIDHFKYFTCIDSTEKVDGKYVDKNKSILNAYSEVYDTFFNYDLKLKKSVPVIFKQILERYFVLADVKFKQEKIVDTKVASFELAPPDRLFPEKILGATCFTYKLKDEEVELYARDEIFLKQVKMMLEFVNEKC